MDVHLHAGGTDAEPKLVNRLRDSRSPYVSYHRGRSLEIKDTDCLIRSGVTWIILSLGSYGMPSP